ncbi:hypothetical protein L7F22_003361 [Adiantum nelumboides]|nr:hypothetical protein [Adiantum nelumboides]
MEVPDTSLSPKVKIIDEEVEDGCESDSAVGKEERRALWQDSWLSQFKWLVYDNQKVRLFCSFCFEYPHSKSAYSKQGSRNFKTSNLKSHARTQCHRDARNAKLWGKTALKEGMKKMYVSQEDALLNLFKAAYFIGKNNLSFAMFPSLLKLMKDTGVKSMTSLYNDDKSCAEIIHCIAKALMEEALDKVRKSAYFGIMIDGSTDISVHHHLVIYFSYIDQGSMPCTTFYGMVRTRDSSAQGIFDAFFIELENANVDVTKLIAFGSDGCSTMVGRKKGVATLLKKLNPRLTAIHCVAHRTNLASCDTSKKIPYARQIDTLVNGIANYFSSSSKRMEHLQDLQEELDCDVVKMQRVFEIRWLSRHACLSKVCKSMDALLVALAKEKEDLYKMLSTFECMYAIHFLADILEKMSVLSKRFQKDYVDVTAIHGIVQSTIMCIKDEYLEERVLDLNASQKGVGDYPIMPEYGAEKGYPYALRSSLRGDMFFGQKITRDTEGGDMVRALDFQFKYAKKLCECLEKRFVDNSILRCVKILVPAQHPMHEKLLRDFGVEECNEIAAFYGIEKVVNNTRFMPFIDGDAFKDEFRKFKRQANIDFAKMSLIEVASLLANNVCWKDVYPNLLKIVEIALVQCCSTAICERGFSACTKIKNKWRNRMETESLDALIRICIEGQAQIDFSNAMEIWKSISKRHLFATEGI